MLAFYVLTVAIPIGGIALIVRSMYRSGERGPWWQRTRPLGWIFAISIFPITALSDFAPSIQVVAILSPLAAIVVLNLARLVGTYRSERDELHRNRAFGEPTHVYLKSTNGIILAVCLLAALALLITAAVLSDQAYPSPLVNTTVEGLFVVALVITGGGVVYYFYRRARRHHENVLIALHHADLSAQTRRPAASGRGTAYLLRRS